MRSTSTETDCAAARTHGRSRRREGALLSTGRRRVCLILATGRPARCGRSCRRVVQSLGRGFDVNGPSNPHRLKRGSCHCARHGLSVDELLSNADLALYEAKAAEAVATLLPSLRAKADAARASTSNCGGPATRKIRLYFPAATHEPTARVTARKRCCDGGIRSRGIIGPGAFIEALADSPVVLEVGRWILETACRTAAALACKRSRTSDGCKPLRAVPGGPIAGRHRECLGQTGLAAEALEIESPRTSRLAMMKLARTVARPARSRGAARVRRLRHRLRLAELPTRYPLTRLKIDQSFVRKIAERPRWRTRRSSGRSS